ncbi:mucin-1-like, partial [Amphibalanus amphitrite]|uniref:mucin-1-like n=1 Tax=Amphibalanus amphitrite TaxID=1232801 RepID=UPI001C91BCB0
MRHQPLPALCRSCGAAQLWPLPARLRSRWSAVSSRADQRLVLVSCWRWPAAPLAAPCPERRRPGHLLASLLITGLLMVLFYTNLAADGCRAPARGQESAADPSLPPPPPPPLPTVAAETPVTPLPVPPLSGDTEEGEPVESGAPAAESPPPPERPAAEVTETGAQPDRPPSASADTGQPPTPTPTPASTPTPTPTPAAAPSQAQGQARSPPPPPTPAPTPAAAPAPVVAGDAPTATTQEPPPSPPPVAPSAPSPAPTPAPEAPAAAPAAEPPSDEPPVVIAKDIRSTLTDGPPPNPEPGPETFTPPPPLTTQPTPGSEPAAGPEAGARSHGSGSGPAPDTAPGENVTSSGAAEDALWPPETGSGEDIQPFNEWASKRVEETQKKTGDTVSPSRPGAGASPVKKPPVRHRIKNYASPDCGAKVLAANPGATSAGNVLSPGRDEYMLNSCDTRVWFVIELCEGIQASRLELSNDELYSSSPREFAVYLTDRYPTREWNKVGQFTAESRRGPQSFHLPTVVFGKFVKVEILSHYGSHYYCTVSNVRVYGASEYEVLDHQDSEQHETETSDFEELMEPAEPTDRPNLFNRALQAVNSMVETAKVAFTGKRDAAGSRAQRCVSLAPGQVPANLSSERQLELGCRLAELSSIAGGRLFGAAERPCRLCGPEEGDRGTPHSRLCGLARALLPADTLQLVCTARPLLAPPAADPAPPAAPAARPPAANGTAEQAPAAET